MALQTGLEAFDMAGWFSSYSLCAALNPAFDSTQVAYVDNEAHVLRLATRIPPRFFLQQ